MEKKIKIVLIVITIGVILIGGFLIWSNYKSSSEIQNTGKIGKIQYHYTVIELPEAEILEMYAKPCMMIYWDNITAYHDRVTGEFDKPINISVYVGKAKSPDEVVDKWANNVAKLEKMYLDATKRYTLAYQELYGNFLWSNKSKTIELRYRTSKGGYYLRDGWYIFTTSPSSFNEGNDYGGFFLSDEGILMPVERTGSMISCP